MTSELDSPSELQEAVRGKANCLTVRCGSTPYLSTLSFSPGNSVILIICPTVFPLTYFPLNLLCFPSCPAGCSTVVVVPQVRMKIHEIQDSSRIQVLKSGFIKTESKHSRDVTGGLFLELPLNESELSYQLVLEFNT